MHGQQNIEFGSDVTLCTNVKLGRTCI